MPKSKEPSPNISIMATIYARVTGKTCNPCLHYHKGGGEIIFSLSSHFFLQHQPSWCKNPKHLYLSLGNGNKLYWSNGDNLQPMHTFPQGGKAEGEKVLKHTVTHIDFKLKMILL
jgi:hypothetical protein